MPQEPPERVRLPVPVRVLFVCLGNICRSPTAEGVMRALVAEQGLGERIEIDSAGTGSWHVGSAPDERATDAARARGLVLEGAARQVSPADLEHFDLLLAMDAENARELRALAQDERQRAKVRLLREFAVRGPCDPAGDDGPPTGDLDVPDPYYGGPGGFEEVLDLVQAACEGLLDEIREGHVPAAPTRS